MAKFNPDLAVCSNCGMNLVKGYNRICTDAKGAVVCINCYNLSSEEAKDGM